MVAPDADRPRRSRLIGNVPAEFLLHAPFAFDFASPPHAGPSGPAIFSNIARESRVITDEALQYKFLRRDFAEHYFVRHNAGEYVRGSVHANTIEDYFNIFKRGMKGVYQHCSEKYLHRYLAEFDFRYNNRAALGVEDAERVESALPGIVGERLTHRRPDHAEGAN